MDIRGLPPNMVWSVNEDGSHTHAGIIDSTGNLIIPRDTNTGITATRYHAQTSAPDAFIPNFRTTYDTITVTEHGTAMPQGCHLIFLLAKGDTLLLR